jgi:hypothetical protein
MQTQQVQTLNSDRHLRLQLMITEAAIQAALERPFPKTAILVRRDGSKIRVWTKSHRPVRQIH